MRNRFQPGPYLEANTGTQAAGNSGDDVQPDGQQGDIRETSRGNQSAETGDVYRTQEDFDKAFARKLTAERKKWQSDADEAAKQAQMSETDRLSAEKQAAEDRATTAVERANQRAVKSEARAIASELGVGSERVKHVLALADLAGVAVDDDGEPDAKAVKAAIEAVLNDVPEFKANGGPAQRSSSDFNGTRNRDTQAPDMNARIRAAMNRN